MANAQFPKMSLFTVPFRHLHTYTSWKNVNVILLHYQKYVLLVNVRLIYLPEQKYGGVKNGMLYSENAKKHTKNLRLSISVTGKKPWVRQNPFCTSLQNKSTLFLHQRKHFGARYDALKGIPPNRRWSIQNFNKSIDRHSDKSDRPRKYLGNKENRTWKLSLKQCLGGA